ncbi:MAG: hypothetical protein WBD13_06935, partial [Burkholderiaceae bacterium]
MKVKDEATFFCLAISADRHVRHGSIQGLLRTLFTRYGTPKAIRSDNGVDVIDGALPNELEEASILFSNGQYEAAGAVLRDA